MKKLTPNPREPWEPAGGIVKIGEFRPDWVVLKSNGPRATELIATYRKKGRGRYIISGQVVGGVRLIALLNFQAQFVRFTTISTNQIQCWILVEQLSVTEFWRRFGLAQVQNPHQNNDLGYEATVVVCAALNQGNQGRNKFQLNGLDTALCWLGMEDCHEMIEELR